MKKRVIAIFVVSVMLLALMPFNVFAVENIGTETLYWGGEVAESFESGSGTEDDPYVITTPEQLAYLAKTVNEGKDYSGEYLLLGNDIYINDASLENWTASAVQWTPIGFYEFNFSEAITNYFRGNFDGNNHVISGLYINSTEGDAGLFGYTQNATIKNLGIVDSYIKGDYAVGGIAGSVYTTVFENCYNTSSTNGNERVGGIVGLALPAGGSTTVIKNCYNTGNITAEKNRTGGIVGGVEGNNVEIYNCYNKGNISGDTQVGGIIGYNGNGANDQVVMNRCYNTGKITGNYRVGGIMGEGWVCIENCYNAGEVSGIEQVGGISGVIPFSTENCYNAGNVTGELMTGSIIGRFAGYDYPVINCYYLEGTAESGFGEYDKYISYGVYEYIPVPDEEGKVIALSEDEMKVQDSFAGFDFVADWTMEGAADYFYPELKMQNFLRGDVNNNGEVAATDYLILKRVIMGATSMEALDAPETAAERCDINGNGEHNATDYILLKRAVMGKYTIIQ